MIQEQQHMQHRKHCFMIQNDPVNKKFLKHTRHDRKRYKNHIRLQTMPSAVTAAFFPFCKDPRTYKWYVIMSSCWLSSLPKLCRIKLRHQASQWQEIPRGARKNFGAYLWCTSPVDGRLQAAKKALCEVPPVRLQCTGGRSPKCVLVQICGGFGAEGLSGCFWQKVGPKVCIFLVRFCQWRGNEVQVSRDIERAKWRGFPSWWSIVFGVITKLGSLMILLMLQKSGNHHLGFVKKPFI